MRGSLAILQPDSAEPGQNLVGAHKPWGEYEARSVHPSSGWSRRLCFGRGNSTRVPLDSKDGLCYTSCDSTLIACMYSLHGGDSCRCGVRFFGPVSQIGLERPPVTPLRVLHCEYSWQAWQVSRPDSGGQVLLGSILYVDVRRKRWAGRLFSVLFWRSVWLLLV